MYTKDALLKNVKNKEILEIILNVKHMIPS